MFETAKDKHGREEKEGEGAKRRNIRKSTGGKGKRGKKEVIGGLCFG